MRKMTACMAKERPLVIRTIELTVDIQPGSSDVHLPDLSEPKATRLQPTCQTKRPLNDRHLLPEPHGVDRPGNAGSHPARYRRFCQAEIAKLKGPSPEFPM